MSNYGHNQTGFQNSLVPEHGRSALAHFSANADADWETMATPPDSERLPTIGVVASSLDSGRETIRILPDWELVLGSGVTTCAADAGWEATDAGRETISIPPDYAHIPAAGVAAGAPGPMTQSPSDCERVLDIGSDAGDPFFVRFYVDNCILVVIRFFQDERKLRRATEPRVESRSIALPSWSTGPHSVGSP